jgi:hypothetical protein
MSTPSSYPPGDNPRRDRREHGGASDRPDDDKLAERTERERAELGLKDYDPDEVPAAADEAVPTDVTDTEEYEEELAEARREVKEGEAQALTEEEPFPPTGYDRE